MQEKKAFLTLTSDKLADYQEAFAYFDIDGNGVLSFDEAKEVIRYLGYNPTNAEAEKLFEEADQN